MLRYWDGSRWTTDTQPTGATPAPEAKSVQPPSQPAGAVEHRAARRAAAAENPPAQDLGGAHQHRAVDDHRAQHRGTDKVPLFGARKLAEELQREDQELQRENQELKRENQELKAVEDRIGAMSLIDVEAETKRLTSELDRVRAEKTDLQTALETEKSKLEKEIEQARSELVETQGLVQMQDVGLY